MAQIKALLLLVSDDRIIMGARGFELVENRLVELKA